jgi:hypothetical protein
MATEWVMLKCIHDPHIINSKLQSDATLQILLYHLGGAGLIICHILFYQMRIFFSLKMR